MNEEERLELRARVLDESIEQHGTLGIPELEEFVKVSEKLRPYRCPGCFTIVYSKDDYVLRKNIEGTGIRTHKACNEKIEADARKFRERRDEQKRRAKQIKYEVEHNLTPISRTISIVVRGLKRDVENLDKNLEQIVKDYNLEPWIRVS